MKYILVILLITASLARADDWRNYAERKDQLAKPVGMVETVYYSKARQGWVHKVTKLPRVNEAMRGRLIHSVINGYPEKYVFGYGNGGKR